MAKINHNSYLDTIDELLRDARRRGVIHLNTDDNELVGRHLTINGQELLNFGTCGYLALEQDARLKEAAIAFVQRFGTQFSVSRTYVSSGSNIVLEELLQQVYGKPVIVYPSTSTAHISLIPTLVRDKHAVILDQQVHMSVQTGAQMVRPRGVPVEMIRHSNLDMLERKLKEWSGKYEKIWYMIDGVYSMYGDIAPLKELVRLMDKYEALHLYIDDAHGMSWYGRHGGGVAFEEIGVPEKVMLVTTLAKGYGVVGGIAVFPNSQLQERVRLFGGPLTYSHPLAPPLLGAAIASAEIHLSDEIYSMQDELRSRIAYCNELMDRKDLPVVSDPSTPIYFVGMGHPRVAYNMVNRLISDGFYVNVGLFPAVPVKCAGLRFTLTRHQSMQDIEALNDAIAWHFPKALADEGRSANEVRRAFHMPLVQEAPAPIPATAQGRYKLEHYTSIDQLDTTEWDNLLRVSSAFTAAGLRPMEKAFSGNRKPEDNWEFHYYIIRDNTGRPVLATFFTLGICKDDLLSPASVSMQIEEKRASDPYYLTSRTLSMGTMITEGFHLYLDRSRPDWKDIMLLLLEETSQLQEKTGANNVMLRDFPQEDTEMRDFLIGEGFVKFNMPNSNIAEGFRWNSYDEYLSGLSVRNRSHIRTDVFRHEDKFEVEIKSKLSREEKELFHSLYQKVKSQNYGINYFPYPEKLFHQLDESPGWEFIILRLKPQYDSRPDRPAVSIGACFRNGDQYSPLLLGLDYENTFQYKVYKQSLFQVMKRAAELGLTKIYFGFSADTDKRKFGAKQYERAAYLQAKDNFNLEVIESMSVLEQ